MTENSEIFSNDDGKISVPNLIFAYVMSGIDIKKNIKGERKEKNNYPDRVSYKYYERTRRILGRLTRHQRGAFELSVY